MRTYVACLALSLVGVMALNRGIDAGGIGATGLVESLGEQQKPGDFIVTPLELERRTLVRSRLVHAEKCPDVLVIGSSTVGKLADGMFPGLVVHNAWIGGPTIEDFESVTAVLHRFACKPRAIVVGVDLWWLGNAALDYRRWMTWVDDYLEAHANDSAAYRASVRAQVLWGNLEESLNFTTTRESARLLGSRLLGSTKLGPRLWHDGFESFCASVTGVHSAFAADGHYESCPRQIPTPEERTLIAERYLAVDMHSMGSWRDVAYDRLDRFEALVREWSQNLASVVLVGMPYHPIAYRHLREDARVRRNMDDVDARLVGMQHGRVEFVSLRDASKVPCTGDEFEDSHHVANACAAKVARRLATETTALKATVVPVALP